MRIDGEPWEVKRMTTGNRTKIKVRLSEDANQAENLVLNLSVNEKNLDALEEAAIEMLADKRVSKLMVVRDGNAYLYEK